MCQTAAITASKSLGHSCNRRCANTVACFCFPLKINVLAASDDDVVDDDDDDDDARPGRKTISNIFCWSFRQ